MLIWIFLAVFVVAAVLAILCDYSVSEPCSFLMIAFGSLLVFCLIVLPITHAATRTLAVKVESIRLSLETARSNPDISEYELAAIQSDVIRVNQKLALTKYWATDIWIGVFTPDYILDVEPVE